MSLMLASASVQAKSWAYKFQIQPSLGVKTECSDEGQEQLSQIRLYFDDAKVSSRPVTPALAKLSVCLLGGKFVKDFFTLPLPSESLQPSEPVQTRTVSVQDKNFDTVEMRRLADNKLSLRFLKKGTVWPLIGEVRLEYVVRGGKKDLSALHLHLTKYNKWVKAPLRLKELAK